jgi:hypothetical protein
MCIMAERVVGRPLIAILHIKMSEVTSPSAVRVQNPAGDIMMLISMGFSIHWVFLDWVVQHAFQKLIGYKNRTRVMDALCSVALEIIISRQGYQGYRSFLGLDITALKIITT